MWPICLPVQESIQSRSFFGEQSVIAGWGRLQEGGKPSNVLQELKLPILENSECEDRFRRRGRLVSDNQFSKLVICAGDLKGGKDSCQGDSGGPMMNATQLDYIKTRYYQIGNKILRVLSLDLYYVFILISCVSLFVQVSSVTELVVQEYKHRAFIHVFRNSLNGFKKWSINKDRLERLNMKFNQHVMTYFNHWMIILFKVKC